MLTIISVIVVIAIIALIISAIRAFTLVPTETYVPNRNFTYPADHFRSKEIFERKNMRNHRVLKLSLVVTVVGAIAIFLLKN
jgi:hypothetical protein